MEKIKNGFLIGMACGLIPIWEGHYNLLVVLVVAAAYIALKEAYEMGGEE